MSQRPKRNFRHQPGSGWNTKIEGPTAVYRLYDADDRLLYVGISIDPKRRWREHADGKLWWHLIARRDVTWCDSRLEALTLEEEIERTEDPKFGDTHRLGSGWRTSDRKTDPVLYREISRLTDVLRQQIFEGRYPLGTELPKDRTIGAENGLSKAIAGHAVSRLYDERLVAHGSRKVLFEAVWQPS